MAFINILNKTNLNLQLLIIYTKKGDSKSTTITSPSFTTGFYQSLYIPYDATKITLKANYKSDKGYWWPLIGVDLPEAVTLCGEVSGTVDKPDINQVKCSNFKNKDYIYFRNKTNIDIKAQVIYLLDGDSAGYKDESTIIYPNKNSTLNIPLNANPVQFSILTQNKQFQWERNSQVIKFQSTPIKKCYDITGTSSNITIKEYNCTTSVNSPILTSPIPSIINPTVPTEFIKILNVTTRKIKVNLNYNNNMVKTNKNTDIIKVDGIANVSIPSTATNIALSIYFLNNNSTWVKLQKSISDLQHPIQKCYKITEINGIFSFLPTNCTNLG